MTILSSPVIENIRIKPKDLKTKLHYSSEILLNTMIIKVAKYSGESGDVGTTIDSKRLGDFGI